ncbi:hypothetical protein KA005_23650 [bacterium]|nr:hypothetical protein [bacterium]
MVVTFEQAFEVIKRKGAGIHHIKGGFYAFGESWDTICVEKECGLIKDPDKFDECAIDYASHVTYNEIPRELRKRGYSVIDVRHVEYPDDNVPSGWSVALLERRFTDF